MFIKWVSWNENVKMDKWKYKERPWNIGIWNEEIPIKIETTIDKRERERERERESYGLVVCKESYGGNWEYDFG